MASLRDNARGNLWQSVNPAIKLHSICAGKHSVAEFLVQHHHFLRLHLPKDSPPGGSSRDESETRSLLPSVSDQKGTRGLTFPDVDALLEFVTRRWREHWVLTDINSAGILDRLLCRPYFLLISVDAPVLLRYARFSERCSLRSIQTPPLSTFLSWSDHDLYSPSSSKLVSLIINHSSLRVLNSFTTIESFYSLLASLNISSASRLRPPWDHYFMRLATLASMRSNCMKRRVGAVLVREARVISTGYNGTPRHLTNCNEGGCARCNLGSSGGASLNTCLCIHAEENALLEAGRDRVGPGGATLYCDTCPCLTCAVKIVQVGIEEVVYAQGYNMDQETARILGEGGVKLRQFMPERSGLVALGDSEDQRLITDHEQGGSNAETITQPQEEASPR